MSEEKLNAVKRAVDTAKEKASEAVASVVSSHSDGFLACLSRAQDSIQDSFDESSPEVNIYLLSFTLIRVCNAVKYLAMCPDLAYIKVEGVMIDSIIKSKSVKKAQVAVKSAKNFIDLYEKEEFGILIDHSLSMLDSCLTILWSIFPRDKQTMVEFSNAFIICSAIAFFASQVALIHSCGDDCVCEKHKS